MSNKNGSQETIAIQDIVLEFILSNGWKDYNNFARQLSDRILEKNSIDMKTLENAIARFSHPFYSFNGISKTEFLKKLPFDLLIYRLRRMPAKEQVIEVNVSASLANPEQKAKSMVSIDEIFPEIISIDIATGKSLAASSLDIYERDIQNALRDYLRERNATNITERKSDSVLEVADIEDFTLRIQRKPKSFSAVVKGAKSIGKKSTITFEDIAHQILKANETHPDHILLIIAKPLADGVTSKFVEYGKDCGNRNLVIIMDTVNLARFLRFRKII